MHRPYDKGISVYEYLIMVISMETECNKLAKNARYFVNQQYILAPGLLPILSKLESASELTHLYSSTSNFFVFNLVFILPMSNFLVFKLKHLLMKNLK